MGKSQANKSTATSNTARSSSNDDKSNRQQTAKREVEKTAAEAKAQAEQVADDIKQKGEQMAAEARERTKQAIHKRQQAAAGQVGDIAGALRRTANELEDDQAWMANGIERAADGLDTIAKRLKDDDFNSLTQRVADYTRRGGRCRYRKRQKRKHRCRYG